MNGRRIALALALAMSVCERAAAQAPWLTMIDGGAGSRLGTLPSGYRSAGSNWNLDLTEARRVRRSLFIGATFGMMLQDLSTPSPDSSAGGTSTFHTYMLAVGPTLVNTPWYGFVTIASVQPALVVSLWGLGSLDNCTIACLGGGNVAPRRETEWRPGAAFSFLVAYELGDKSLGSRPWSLGIQLRGLAAPVHRESGIPVSQVSVNLGFIAGEP